ncbi:hypothetical protein KY338_05895 [Candidatus Woesearchaeota archaeon]|nr:hypothetical protein [Candidatus Woesearchaeota archaeon]MBW3006288.1 hypothetical protein [Candidatus Woesearchaeota archaeon]
MKKRVLIILITVLLASFVYAEDAIPRTDSVTDLPKIERQTNFMGDNVHILLIEDLAEKMGVQVEELDLKLVEMQNKIEDLEQMKSNMQQGTKATGYAIQLNEINGELTELRKSIHDIKNAQAIAEPEVKENSNLGAYIIALLGFNGILLILVTGLIIHKKAQKEPTKTLHEYIAHCVDDGETQKEIKEDLLSQGWTSQQIEKAFKEI